MSIRLAYRAGVTSAITPPAFYGFLSGLSVHFSTGAAHKLEKGAVLQDAVALHFAIQQFGTPSVSTQIAALRKLLLDKHSGEFADAYESVQTVCSPTRLCLFRWLTRAYTGQDASRH